MPLHGCDPKTYHVNLFSCLNQFFYDLHIRHFVTQCTSGCFYEILALLKIELHDSCVDNSKAACTYQNDQNYCFS